MDGESLINYFNLNINEENEIFNSKQEFLIEYYGEQYNGKTGISTCGGYPGFESTVCDMWNNSYHCVRTINTTQSEINGSIYCDFQCYDSSHGEIACNPSTVQGQGEYYNLDKDYFEIDNIWATLNKNEVNQYKG
eukprot:935542_1